MTAPIAIIMGSQSDWETMRHAADTLEALGVAHEALIVSAHRTPDRLYAFAKGAKAAGHKVIIAGAGGAAHLPGMTAAMTDAAGVRRAGARSKALSGVDSLYSIVQMPAGDSGRHTGDRQGRARSMPRLLAASVLALNDDAARPAGSTAWRAAADRRRRRPPGDRGVTRLCAGASKPGDDNRHSGRRPARARCWRWRRRASASRCHVYSRAIRTRLPSTWCRRATCAEYADVGGAATKLRRRRSTSSPMNSRTCRSGTATFLAATAGRCCRRADPRDHAGPAGRKELRHQARHRRPRAYADVDLGRGRCTARSRASAGRRC